MPDLFDQFRSESPKESADLFAQFQNEDSTPPQRLSAARYIQPADRGQQSQMGVRRKLQDSPFLSNPGLAPEEREQRMYQIGLATGEPEINQASKVAGATEALNRVPGSVTREIVAGATQAVLSASSVRSRPLEMFGAPVDRINEWGSAFGQAVRDTNKESWLPQPLLKAIGGAARSFSSMGIAVASGVPGEMGVIGSFAAEAGDQALTDARRRGLSTTETIAYVTEQAVAEGGVAAIFSRMGLGGMEKTFTAPLKQAAKGAVNSGLQSAAKQFGKQTVAELSEETITEVLQKLSAYIHDVDPSTDFAKLQEYDGAEWGKFARDMGQVALTTALSMGTIEAGRWGLSHAASDPSATSMIEEQAKGVEAGPIEDTLNNEQEAIRKPPTGGFSEGPELGEGPHEYAPFPTEMPPGSFGTVEEAAVAEAAVAQPDPTNMQEMSGPLMADALDVEFIDVSDPSGATPEGHQRFFDPVTGKPFSVGPNESADIKLQELRAVEGYVKPEDSVKTRIQKGLEVGANAANATRDFLNEYVFHPDKTYKREQGFLDRKDAKMGAVNLARDQAQRWSKRLGKVLKRSGLYNGTREQAYKLEKTLSGEIPFSAWPQEVQSILTEGRTLMDTHSQIYADKLRAVGLVEKAKGIEANIGVYVKGVPRWTLDPISRAVRKLQGRGAVENSLSGAYDKAKRDSWIVQRGRKKRTLGKYDTQAEAKAFVDTLSDQMKREVKIKPPRTDAERFAEDVHDPGFLLAAGATQTAHDTQMLELHHYVAETQGVTVPANVAKRGVEATQDWLNQHREATGEELVKMPHAGNYHGLNNMYVPIKTAEDLTHMVELPGLVAGWLRGYNSLYKQGILVWNPATWFRDAAGNTLIFSTLDGNSPINPANWGNFVSAVNSMKNKDAVWEDALRHGVVGTEFARVESRELRGYASPEGAVDLNWIMKTLNTAHGGAKFGHGLSDVVFKLAAFHNNLKDKTVSTEESAKAVRRAYPDYSNVSTFAKYMSHAPFGNMFARFTDQSMRIFYRSAKKNPLKLAMLMSMPGIIDSIGRSMAGVGEDEEAVIRAGQSLMERYFMPVVGRDSKGKVITFDLRYIFILANDIIPTVNASNQLAIPWLLNNPLATTVLNQWSGMDRFTGKKMKTVGDRVFNIGKTTIPLPSLVKYGPTRISKSLDEENPLREDTANAVLGVVAGFNFRRPYTAVREIEKVVIDAIKDDDIELAGAIVESWNEDYKPKMVRPLKLITLIRRVRKRERELQYER